MARSGAVSWCNLPRRHSWRWSTTDLRRIPEPDYSSGCFGDRYSTRHQDSIADQVRVQLEDTSRRGIFVPRENFFFDLAIKGFKSQRDGLNGLRELLARRHATVLFLFATNRLLRKVYRTLEFVDQASPEWGVRVIFVKSGVDTDDRKQCEMLLHVHSIMDQFVVTMYADNVRAAHEGLFAKRLVFGTISCGYGGEPIPGETTRRGRPRCRLVVDDEEAAIVRQIFDWYVSDLGRYVSDFLAKDR